MTSDIAFPAPWVFSSTALASERPAAICAETEASNEDAAADAEADAEAAAADTDSSTDAFAEASAEGSCPEKELTSGCRGLVVAEDPDGEEEQPAATRTAHPSRVAASAVRRYAPVAAGRA
ncbi:hypothetical protein [Kitasatospora sp. NPDC017646]|uniref:hypothetical protein n=1 Tax=Kitasatospora sp. NPDC017646 TaxID=3364024 RepID=UPI00378D681A